MAKTLKEQAASMAAMNPKKGEGHPWWATASAVLAVYETKNKKMIAIMEDAYNKAIR